MNENDDKDIFEILGINGREDSYTNLIDFAFNNSVDFRRKFCTWFMGDYSEDSKLVIRSSQRNLEIKGRKDNPDMLLISNKANEIVLIENKVFSTEGFNQTERYSNEEFVKSVKNRFEMKDAKFDKFFYLTIDGKQPISNKFKSVKWSTVILECCEGVEFGNLRLRILMADLVAKIEHYEEFLKPLDSAKFLDYFSNNKKWIKSNRTFEKIFTDVCEKIRFQYSVDYSFGSANNANGEQFLILFSTDNWVNGYIDDTKMYELSESELIDLAKSRNIHIELNWTPSLNRISLYIHYETNPYLTRKKFCLLYTSPSPRD